MFSHFPVHVFISPNNVTILKNKTSMDFDILNNVTTENNLKEAYDIDVKVMVLSDDRKICVPIKSNFTFDFTGFSDKG